MEVKSLSAFTDRISLMEEWESQSNYNLDAIRESMLADSSSNSNWHKIVDTTISSENAPAVAVFDVRCVPFNSPIYHKSLTIHFAPGFDPESMLSSPDGQTLEDRIKL